MLWLYSTSFLIIWASVFILQKWFIPEGIFNAIRNPPAFPYLCWSAACFLPSACRSR
jgi:hypothetical protein